MAAILLDTTVVIDLLRGRTEAVRRLRAIRDAGDSPCVCAINVEETVRGLRPAESEPARRLFSGLHVVPLGEAAVRREGGDVTVVAIGWMVGKALAAAEQLAADGVEAEVIDPRTLAPLDTATILQSVEKTGRLVVVDQSTRHGSAAAVIAAEVASEGFASLKAPVRLVTALDATIPYSAPMEAYLLPDEAKIVEAVQQVLGSAPVGV